MNSMLAWGPQERENRWDLYWLLGVVSKGVLELHSLESERKRETISG